ncbi:hypothetical protein Tco_1032081 [Tanacetum coccineum]|uniref:Uncharacterized protein n=1 Tax=Tanacetum coccineum TaxID=301880 RepID=A0ABQ5GCB2_9ASTR
MARKNELKAKSTLLLAILDEHLLKFHGIKDEKTLWEAIKTRVWRQQRIKKMQKNHLKKQYENFTASRSEGLDKTYDRFQKLISQLEIHGEVISQEDANLKLLRSLPLTWNNIALIMRNKYDLDTMSMDDLYNNLKVTNEAVNTAHEVSTASTQGQASSSTYADDVMFSFFVNQSNSEEFIKKTGRAPRNQGNRNRDAPRRIVPVETPANALVVQDGIGGYDWSYQAEEGPTDFALMAHLSSGSSSSSSSDSEVHTCSKDCLKSYETLQKQYDQQRDALKKSNLEIIGYQIGLESLEARIVVHKKMKLFLRKTLHFLKYDVKVRDNSITKLKNQLAEALKEKDDLKLKLEKFETSSMKLTKLINSQISVNNKSGVGFDSQMNENKLHDFHLNKREVFESASDSSVNEIEEENNQVNDRFKKVEGYHAVLPPYTRNYMPSRPDLSFVGLDDSVYKTNMSETITSVPRNESITSKSSKDSLEQPKDVRPSAPIIEEWESDSVDDCVVRPSFEQNKPSHAKINFVKSDENTRKSVIEQRTYRQAEHLRKSQTCFVYGSLNHLIKDYNFYENKMVGKSVLNNVRRATGQREVRPIWNNAQRVNHQNKLSHPHPKRNFVPTVVLTKSGNVPFNTAMQSSSRASVSNSTARYGNTLASKPTMNGAKPSLNVFHKSHSSVKRTFYQRTTPKNSDFKENVNTAKVNNVTTAVTKALVSAVQGHEANVVKSSACWIWRPIGKVFNHISKYNGSYMPERLNYVDPQGRLKSVLAWVPKRN